MVTSRIIEGKKTEFAGHHYGDQYVFRWALDPQFINIRFCLTAVHELYQLDKQIEKVI